MSNETAATTSSPASTGSELIIVGAMTSEVREVLMGARKWLMRIHHRIDELPPGFVDGCDPKPLADDIARLLASNATTQPQREEAK